MKTLLGLAFFLAVLPAAAFDGSSAAGVRPWPGGLVVYRFDPSVGPGEREAFGRALALWSWQGSPVRFREETGGWASGLGWFWGLDRSLLVREAPELRTFGRTALGAGTRRELVFNPKRSSPEWLTADLAHEVGHVLGLTHEHQRRDRDRYVAFPPGFLESLPQDRAADYAPDPGDPAPGEERPYDWDSLMQYSSNIDGNGMVRRDTGALIPGAREPSAGDRLRLARLYGVPAAGPEAGIRFDRLTRVRQVSQNHWVEPQADSSDRGWPQTGQSHPAGSPGRPSGEGEPPAVTAGPPRTVPGEGRRGRQRR